MKIASSAFGEKVQALLPHVNEKGLLVSTNDVATTFFFDQDPQVTTDAVLVLSAKVRHHKDPHAVLVGTREWNDLEHEYLAHHRVAYYSADEIAKEGIRTMCDAIMSRVKNYHSLTILIYADILDPVFGDRDAPAAGFTSRELVYLCSRLSYIKNIRMLGIEEFTGLEKLYAKIVGEFSS